MDERRACFCRLSHFRAGKGHVKDFGSPRLLELYQKSKTLYIYGNKCGVCKEHYIHTSDPCCGPEKGTAVNSKCIHVNIEPTV